MKTILTAAAVLCIMAGCSTPAANESYADYVDTGIGTRDDRGSNCVVGPQMPYGSINPSPQTENGGMDGYDPLSPIRGFGQLHVSGTGWSSYGHFLVSPQTGLDVSLTGHDSPHSNDVNKAYYYSTTLDRYGIKAEIAPSHYSAIYRFTYPQSEQSSIVFDASQSIIADIVKEMKGTVIDNSAEIDAATGKVRMMIRFRGGWPGGAYNLYLAGMTDKTPAEAGVWKNGELMPGVTSISKDSTQAGHIGAYCTFATKADEQVMLKLAISFNSFEKAEELLQSEIPGWDFDKVKEDGRKKWNDKLATIDIETPSDEQKTIFYSALYRTFTMARDRSRDSQWQSGLPYWDDNYAYWDTFRSVYPLLTLVDEPAVRDNILAMTDRFAHNRNLRDGFIAGIERPDDQGGNDLDHVIVDAYLKGVKGVDWEKAYEIVKYNADNQRIGHTGRENSSNDNCMRYKELGWIPSCLMSCSQTLEFAYNDYCAALMAKGLGHDDDAALYAARSHKWTTLWNDSLESHGFKGFIDARNEDGTFANFDPALYGGSWISPFYEAASWTYSYYMPHDMDTVIALMGGNEKFVERLTYGFENNLIEYTNEPAFLTQRAFTHAGRPDLSSYWVHHIMNTFYDTAGYPGNDDTGAMASWYVFCSTGLFPNAGQDYYYLNAPLYGKTVITMSDGHKLTITANAAKENIYIESCKIDGKQWDSPYITHSQLMKASHIEMKLSSSPTQWGKDAAAPSAQI